MASSRRATGTGLPIPEKVLWLALVTWALGFVGLAAASTLLRFRPGHVEYLAFTALVSLGAVTFIALAGPPALPGELRRLRVLAVVLPAAFIAVVEVSLYLLTTYGVVAEPAQHVLAMAILTAGVVPLSFYVFRTFAGLRNELAGHAYRLQALHGTSLAVTREPRLTRLAEIIAENARTVLRSDLAALRLTLSGGPTVVLPDGSVLSDWESDLMRSAIATETRTQGRRVGRSALAVPLSSRGHVVGVLAVMRNSADEFTTEDELLLDMFAVAASSGLENARRLEEAQLLATVEERERIARDLHDDLGQLLGFLSAKVRAIKELVATGRPEKATQELAGLERHIHTLGTQVREAILGLRTQVGIERPLGETLRDYSADFGALAGLDVTFDGRADAGRDLPGLQQYQMLRIVQEALSNVRRHAQARSVCVRVTEERDHLEVSVADDGRGFSPAVVSTGFGLKTMAERTKSLNGTLEVESDPASGTTVRVRVPIEEG